MFPTADCSKARERYQGRLDEISHQTDDLGRRNGQLNLIRGGLFLAGFVALLVGYGAGQGVLWLVVPGWILLFAFLCVITWHESIRIRLEALRRRRGLYRVLLARLDRQWERLPEYTPEGFDDAWLDRDARATALDLDVFGKGSLFQFVSLAGTETGKDTIARWLCEPAIREMAEARNVAIIAVAGLAEQREEFYARSRDVAAMSASPEKFRAWAIDPAWLAGPRSILLVLARMVAMVPLVIWPLFALGVLSLSVAVIAQALNFSGDAAIAATSRGRA